MGSVSVEWNAFSKPTDVLMTSIGFACISRINGNPIVFGSIEKFLLKYGLLVSHMILALAQLHTYVIQAN